MIEKIGTADYLGISKPCEDAVKILEKYRTSANGNIAVCEIGVGIGATAIEMVKLLGEDDSYYFFSFEEEVNALYEDLQKLDYCVCNLHPMANTKRTYDSYSWNLAKMILDEKENKDFFDFVYLDGAHTFIHDAITTVLLKRMIKVGGILLFDDVDWTLATSPTMSPSVNSNTSMRYSDEQIEACHISMVTELFMEDDEKWERISDVSKGRLAYKRLA
ncbi:class I SAM-dependent methyltransferase [Butyrivibrio sp. XPD2002]|uniref:class I SAM-dependent methyltransferase n=1 Tax=Butyrivibrio sp. XPD2002 TaxID=1280665 RepID=UPI00040AC058|nr:class I SAM-dependent methyltransferase [Butyrivibrio sp. XPD2002]